MPEATPVIPPEAVQFLQALGRHDLDSVRVRCIHWSKSKAYPTRNLSLGRDAEAIAKLSEAGYGIYYVVNPGGDKDDDITTAVASFAEWDDRPIEEQLATDWTRWGLPAPTLQVATGGKSIHHYWVYSTPTDDLEGWRKLQHRQNAALGTDSTLKNPSRVLRLPGYRYWYAPDKAKAAGVEPGSPGGMVELLTREPGSCTTLEELSAALDVWEQQNQPAQSPAATTPAPQQRRRRSEFEVYPPDSLEDIQAALACIPPRIPGLSSITGQESTYREYLYILWGLCSAVEKAGYSRATAVALMENHSPAWAEAEGGSLERIANSTRYDIDPGAFWGPAYKYGYRPSHWRNDSPGNRRNGSSGAGGGGGGTGGNGGGDGDDDDGDRTRLQRLDPHDLVDFIANYYGDRLRWNELTLYVEIDGKPLLSGEIQRYYITLSELGIKASKELAVDALYHAACRNTFNPVTSYLERVAETVEPISIDDLATRYLRPGDSPGSLSDRMLRATLIGAVRRAFEPGAKHDTACILVGAQGARKSTFWRVLGGKWFDDSLGDLGKQTDSCLVLHRCWIQEWGEIDHVTGKRHAGQIKAFLSRADDAFRHPYGRNVDSHPRRGIIVGSTNREEFLSDESGNRRFLPITVTVPGKIDTDRLAAERDAIWAAAVLAYRAGEPNYLGETDEALVCELNEEHLTIHPWQPAISSWLESAQGSLEAKSRRVTIPRLLTEVVMKPLDHQTKADQMAIADILKRLGWELKRSKGRRWWVPTDSAPNPEQPPEEPAQDPQPTSLGWGQAPTAAADSPEQPAAPPPEDTDNPTPEQISRAFFAFDDEERATGQLLTPPTFGEQSPPAAADADPDGIQAYGNWILDGARLN